MALLVALGLVACGGDETDTDAGTGADGGPRDAGATVDAGGGTDAGEGSDAGEATDAGGGTDAGESTDAGEDTDAGEGSDAGACTAAGTECTGFPETFAQDATSVDNCAGHIHQTDCCGARRVFGINHGERNTLCDAEDTCAAMYPTASCSDDTITTDSGDTTTDIDDVRVRCVPGSGATCTCETIVCTTGPCRATSAPIGSCGG